MILSSILFQLLSFANGLNDFNMYVVTFPKPWSQVLQSSVCDLYLMHINIPGITLLPKSKPKKSPHWVNPQAIVFISFSWSHWIDYLSPVCLWSGSLSVLSDYPIYQELLIFLPSLSFMINHFRIALIRNIEFFIVFMPTFHFLNLIKPIVLFILLCP